MKHKSMRTKDSNLVILILTLIAVSAVIPAFADCAVRREDKIKAAFLYNFMNFVDWPKDKIADANQPIKVGVTGSRVFLEALEPLKEKKIKGRKISIKYFSDYEKLNNSKDFDDDFWNEKIERIKTCHVIIFCKCDSDTVRSLEQIVKALKSSPVLTVGEMNGFLESGGMINFLIKEEKVRFEINNAAAKKAGLRISSKLLRLAERVVEED